VKLSASSFHVGLGGKGANQAVACAKVSRLENSLSDGQADVRMVGAIGDDVYGTMMSGGLKGFGVDISGVKIRNGHRTGVAVTIVEENSGENRILISAEANASLSPSQFTELPAPLPSLVILQLEIPLDTVIQILTAAKKQRVPVLLNPAPAQKIPLDYYNGLTHLIVNESEAMLLSDCAESDLGNVHGLRKAAQTFVNLGVKNVLITLGANGAYFETSLGSRGLIPAEKVEVVDTTAAGDTFVGVYALEAVKLNFQIEEAVKRATRAAAKTVQRKGAQESIPWLDELE
jgi:ribokinase